MQPNFPGSLTSKDKLLTIYQIISILTFFIIFFLNKFPDVPEAPNSPDVSNIDKTSIKVTWSPPEHDGGSEITGYIVERRDAGRDRWVKAHKKPLMDTSFTATDLIEGKEYEFRISAENKAGVGEPSAPSVTIRAKLPFGKNLIYL